MPPLENYYPRSGKRGGPLPHPATWNLRTRHWAAPPTSARASAATDTRRPNRPPIIPGIKSERLIRYQTRDASLCRPILDC